MKKRALIVGATGLVGSFLLQKLLDSDRYEKVISLVRRPVELQHVKLQQVLFDFDNPDLSTITADDIYCCLGTTIGKAGSKDAFRRVDFDYPLAIAQMTKANGADRFAVVTSMGSDAKSMFFYSRVKGELEIELKKIPFKGLYIFRPSMLLGNRIEKRFGESAAKAVMNIFSFAIPSSVKGVHAAKVAGAMLEKVSHGTDGTHYIDSAAIQKYK